MEDPALPFIAATPACHNLNESNTSVKFSGHLLCNDADKQFIFTAARSLTGSDGNLRYSESKKPGYMS